MRTLGLVVCLVAFTGCKKKEPDAVPLGTTGLSFDVSRRAMNTLLVEERSPGYWNVSADGNGLTQVFGTNERGMPTREHLERSQHEDELIGERGSVAEGSNGMLIYQVTRTHCSSCKDGKPQFFLTAYVPTADGAARCEGWSEESTGDEHLTICRNLMSSTKPSAAATPKGDTAPPPSGGPPAPPKP